MGQEEPEGKCLWGYIIGTQCAGRLIDACDDTAAVSFSLRTQKDMYLNRHESLYDAGLPRS